MKKTFFFSVVIFITCSTVPAQEAWIEYYRDTKTRIEYRYEDCHDPQQGTHRQYVMLRFINLTAKETQVNYSKELWYNGKCFNCGNPSEENEFSINIPANGILEGSCANRDKSLRIFSKMLNMEKSTLTNFVLKNITVTEK